MSNIKTNTLLSSLITALGIAVLTSSSIVNAEDVISSNVPADIQEPAGTYDTDNPTLINMSVTTVIGSGACVTDNYVGCTLNDVLNDVDSHDEFKPEIKVHFSADNYPDDGLVSNAEMRQRGNESRYAPQKSFRIKLDKNIPTPLWRGERKIQLMKSAYDPSRIRNKLAYDLFVEIPHLPSMRSQFAHLDITNQGVTEDYGLYTQIEYFGKEYLKRRGWDKDSRVYKVEDFAYGYYDNSAFDLDANGKFINEADFEKLMEIKRGKSHFDVVNMIKDLNDLSVDFNTEIMGKYFNRDNYLTWFAVNILLSNQDTHYHNYYLYNPKDKDDFYLIPWDYDASLGMVADTPEITEARLPRWWFSHANFWKIKLHQRFLSEPGNLALLNNAVAEIKNKYFTSEKIQAKRDAYYDIVFPHITSTPDADFIDLPGNNDPERIASYNQIFDKLSNQVEIQYARFQERLNDPMIFKMREPVFESNHNIVFKWDESVSLTGQNIVYDLDIASTKEMQAGSIIEHITNISATNYRVHWTHPKGTYYYRVTARDSANPQQHWQVSNSGNLYYDNGWLEIHGVLSVYVSEDGDTTTPPPTGVSNPVSTITINGNSSDWSGTTAFATDPDDISDGGGNVIDWQSATFAHNDETLFMLYRNRGPIDPNRNSGSYTSWGWQTFLDTDNNPNTGLKINDSFGADYLLEANELQRYTGSGHNWSWQGEGNAVSRFNGTIDEIALSRHLIGNPSSLRVIFQGANEAYGGNTLDNYPDSGYLSYSFGTVTTPTNHAPIAANQSLSVVVNNDASISLNASDADGDSLNVNIIQQPDNGSLTGSGLNVQYTPNQNYTGTDSFRYRVNDGTVNSNTATVSINVVDDNPGTGISNHVVNGGISVNGNSSDWNNLSLFANDPDDISGANNTIDWLRAGLAHSSDTVYLMYQNRGDIDQYNTSGSHLSWGWQTFLDTDNNPNTGYQLNGNMGADYMVEGQEVFRYNGSGWSWTSMGTANTKFNNTIAELSFPRSWIGTHSNVKVAFLGNNEAVGGSSIDEYPNNGGSFEYYFGSGTAGRATPVASNQLGILNSSQHHQPHLNSNEVKSGGGSFSWLLLLPSLLLLRRRLLISHLQK